MAGKLPQIDLRPPEADPWARVAVPLGWEPIGRICRHVSEDVDRLTDHIVNCIEDEIPAYRGAAGVPRPDLSASVRRNMEMMFFGLAERRGPLPEELEVRRELGHRRASQGLPIDALLQAYHVGYRELWLELVEQAGSEGAAAQALLLTAATTFWGWIQEITNAVAEAYDETSRAREAHANGVRQRFIELLVSGDLESEHLAELTMSLGFDPEGSYRALCARPNSLNGSEPERLQRALRGLSGTHQWVVRGQELLILSQNADANAVEAAIYRAVGKAPMGMGVARSGSAGARLSIADAERALALAMREGGTVRFEEKWFPSVVLRSQEQLHELLSVGCAVAARHPHLAHAVRAYAESGFSVSETARRMSLHANSVTYRLDRWQQLTGWNPRSFSGLVSSLACLEMTE